MRFSWKDATEAEIKALAAAWAAEAEGEDEDAQRSVIAMNFTAPAALQWLYILEAVTLAQTDDQLGSIAAGPMEHLLGHHGDDYIALFEQHARADLKFAAAVRGMWQYKISDENWRRIQAIQKHSVQ